MEYLRPLGEEGHNGLGHSGAAVTEGILSTLPQGILTYKQRKEIVAAYLKTPPKHFEKKAALTPTQDGNLTV